MRVSVGLEAASDILDDLGRAARFAGAEGCVSCRRHRGLRRNGRTRLRPCAAGDDLPARGGLRPHGLRAAEPLVRASRGKRARSRSSRAWALRGRAARIHPRAGGLDGCADWRGRRERQRGSLAIPWVRSSRSRRRRAIRTGSRRSGSSPAGSPCRSRPSCSAPPRPVITPRST